MFGWPLGNCWLSPFQIRGTTHMIPTLFWISSDKSETLHSVTASILSSAFKIIFAFSLIFIVYLILFIFSCNIFKLHKLFFWKMWTIKFNEKYIGSNKMKNYRVNLSLIYVGGVNFLKCVSGPAISLTS